MSYLGVAQDSHPGLPSPAASSPGSGPWCSSPQAVSVVPSGSWSSGVQGLVLTFLIPSLISTAMGIPPHSWPPHPTFGICLPLLSGTVRLAPRHLDATFLS